VEVNVDGSISYPEPTFDLNSSGNFTSSTPFLTRFFF
jgi:hypothetical protein